MWTSQFRKVKNSEKGTHFGDCKIENQQFWGKHTVKDNKSRENYVHSLWPTNVTSENPA